MFNKSLKDTWTGHYEIKRHLSSGTESNPKPVVIKDDSLLGIKDLYSDDFVNENENEICSDSNGTTRYKGNKSHFNNSVNVNTDNNDFSLQKTMNREEEKEEDEERLCDGVSGLKIDNHSIYEGVFLFYYFLFLA